MEVNKFFEDVYKEVEKAEKKFGNFASLHESYAVLLEEVDEFWDHVKKKEYERNSEEIYEELVQIAAISLRTALNILNKG